MDRRDLTDQDRVILDRAFSARNRGDYEAACRDFTVLIQRHPKLCTPYVMKGAILLYKLQRTDEAIECFKKAVELRPTHELVSRCLFHSYWEKGDMINAVKEIKRFIAAGGRSRHYEKIVKEMLEKMDLL